VYFVKKMQTSNFLRFLSLKAENWWKKLSIKRKTGVTVLPRSLNPGKAIALAICPITCSFYYLARTLMHDVACAEGCAETISAVIC